MPEPSPGILNSEFNDQRPRNGIDGIETALGPTMTSATIVTIVGIVTVELKLKLELGLELELELELDLGCALKCGLIGLGTDLGFGVPAEGGFPLAAGTHCKSAPCPPLLLETTRYEALVVRCRCMSCSVSGERQCSPAELYMPVHRCRESIAVPHDDPQIGSRENGASHQVFSRITHQCVCVRVVSAKPLSM